MSLKKKGTNNVIDSANHTFRLPILLGGTGAREANVYVIGGKEIMKIRVIKLPTMIALKSFYFTIKLSINISTKMDEF